MPADVRLVEFTGQYGPNLEGFVKTATPRPLDHNFHIREATKNEVPPYWGFVPREKYRLLEPTIALANVGDAPMFLGNVFTHPQFYLPISPPQWAVIIQKIFWYRIDQGDRKELRVIILWDAVPAAPGFPKAPGGFLDVVLSPGWGAVLVEPMWAPIDITDLPDGPHQLSFEVAPPAVLPHIVDFNVVINKFDLRLTP